MFTNLIASLLSVAPVKSTEKCSDAKDGSCVAWNNPEALTRSVGSSYPIMEMLQDLFAPAGISNHLSDIIFIHTTLAMGWIIGGKVKVLGSIYKLNGTANLAHWAGLTCACQLCPKRTMWEFKKKIFPCF